MRIPPIVCAAVAIVGLGRSASVHLYKEWYRRGLATPPRIDARYEELKAALPPVERLGYLSDAPGGERRGRRYFEAAYALAPRILEDNGAAPYLVADLEDPARLAELCRENGLRPVFVGRAVALLERAR